MMHGTPSSGPGHESNGGWWILDPRRSLCARTALATGGTAILFTLLVCWIAGALVHRQLEQQLGASFEKQAYQLGEKFDRSIHERFNEIQFVSRLPLWRTPGTSVEERRNLLEALRESSPEYAWLGFANASGTVVAATQHVFEGGSASMRNWFRNGRGSPVAGPVHEYPELARETADPADPSPRFIDLSAPVGSASGQFLGVLGAHLAWPLDREVPDPAAPVPARRDHLGVTLYSAAREVLLDSGSSGWSEPFDAPVLPDPPKLRGSFIENTPNGVTFLTGYAHSRGYGGFPGFNWLIAVRQPVADAFAPVEELQRGILRPGLMLSGLAAVAGWFFAARLTHRLRVIGASARRIRAGDPLTVLPPPRDRGEISAMCAELGDMVHEFRQQQEKLESANLRLAARLNALEKPPKS